MWLLVGELLRNTGAVVEGAASPKVGNDQEQLKTTLHPTSA